MGGVEIALLGAGIVVVAAFTSVSAYFAHRRTARHPPDEADLPYLEARLQPADVPLKVRVVGDAGLYSPCTSIRVYGISDRLMLTREPQGTPEDPNALLRSELEVGDPEFDRVFFVRGPQPLVLALLDAPTRRLLRNLAEGPATEITAERGELRVNVPLDHRQEAGRIQLWGRDTLDIARRLLPPPDVARRLAGNGRGDPVAEVRLRNLATAAREFPGDPQTRAALKAALEDRDPEVRLRAARALGSEGRDALLAMAAAYDTGDEYRETAVRALGNDVPEDLLLSVLSRCMGRRPGDVPDQPRSARACVAALGGKRTPATASRLQALLLANAHLAGDAARAVGRLGGEEAEAILIGALDCDVFESRLAAAEALGEVGTTAAVPPLREAQRYGVELSRVAKQAIAQIQARATQAPGALSLAGAEAGQVSVVDDPAGQVSLPPEKRR